MIILREKFVVVAILLNKIVYMVTAFWAISCFQFSYGAEDIAAGYALLFKVISTHGLKFKVWNNVTKGIHE